MSPFFVGPGDVTIKGPAKPTNIKRLSLDGRIKHLDNITTLFKYTNATPIRCEKDSRYGCCFCAELFGDPAELKQHNIKTHPAVMDSIMRGKRLYDYLVKLDITGLTCNLCTIDLDNLDAMMLHLKGHKKPMHMDINNHIVPFSFDTDDLKCAICKTGFNSFRQLYLHMHSHYRNHVCYVCAAGFVNEKSFDVHYQTHQKGVFHCKYCQKEFDTLSRKRSHESGVHTNSQRFRCSYCSEKFSNSSKKEKHIRKVHNVRAREVKCKLCERVCSSMESLRVHTKRDHLMERNYECKFCNNKYFRLNELKKHTATHTGVREYPCEVCHKSFARKTALVEHIMRVHADASEVK